MNVPNSITIGRVVLALGTVALCFIPSDAVRYTAFGLTVVVIWADGLDGYFARKLNQATKAGAVLDIAGDRVVEMAYWISFSVLGWIPLWIPLLFLVRGTFVDAIRSQAAEHGLTAFGSKTMMETPLGKFLVSSNFMRFSYAVVKAFAFCLLIAANTSAARTTFVPAVAVACAYLAAFMCVIRGVPVLIEGSRFLAGNNQS